MDWNDPQAKALLDEFVASFEDRSASLLESAARADWDEARLQAHRLAGAAESYGFPTLTDAGADVDDFIRLGGAEKDPGAAREYVELLAEMLEVAARTRLDPAAHESDKRFRRLTSDVESLLAAATP